MNRVDLIARLQQAALAAETLGHELGNLALACHEAAPIVAGCVNIAATQARVTHRVIEITLHHLDGRAL